MDESVSANKKKNDVQARRLSLIDVSSEDDSLIGLASDYLQDHQSSEIREQRSDESFEAVAANKSEDMDSTINYRGLGPQPSEGLESERTRKDGKYNLRKSLAWDSAFFTSAGFLDPDELSSMTGVHKGGKRMLPGIQEEIHRSSDSISTLGSDTLTVESIEANLFEDVRASIQKSSTASKMKRAKAGSEVTEIKISIASDRVDLASQSQDKVKPKLASKKPSTSMQNPGKLTKQSVAASGNSTSALLKRPKVIGKPTPISTTSAKRVSLGGNLVKMGKDNVKSTAGRGAPAAKIPPSSLIVPRPKLSSRSSTLGSTTAKTEATSSSFDSIGTASSEKIGKSPFSSMKRKIDSMTAKPHSSGRNIQKPSRTAPRNKTESGRSHQSDHLTTLTKLSSSISPASSISDWSSESASSASTLKQSSCTSRTSVDRSSCKTVSTECDEPGLDLQNHADDQCSVRDESHGVELLGQHTLRTSMTVSALPPASKPSGLRLPSPKIGFFDGVKSAIRTPKGSMQPHPVVSGNLPKIGAPSVISSAGQSKAKLGKLQSTKTQNLQISNAKSDTQLTTLKMKPKSPALEEASKTAKKVSSASSNAERCHVECSKVKKKTPPKSGRESYPKAKEVRTEPHDIAIDEIGASCVDMNASLDMLRDKVSPETKGNADRRDLKITPVDGGKTAVDDLSAISNSENITLSEEVVEDALHAKHEFKNDLQSLNNTEENERAHFEDQVDSLTKQVGAMGIAMGTPKMLIDDSLSSPQCNFGSEDNIGGPQLSQIEPLVCAGKEESASIFSKPSVPLSPTTFENTAGKRIPLAVKDSFCNIGGLQNDFSTGSTVLEVDKDSNLAFSEGHLGGEQLR
ncbi:hypothetical protein FNV43_RR16009 [Rhamnella rubrinervis]|uniref:Uncharacterized protein n=1 Tax=Rhamnella rubrinervis TaxID=2594499 RepID=A0A8K0GXR1_9ROSA|nr:hypothetical protein FNV43_RR16009 [Rhamnella rubrinervis]